MDLKVTITCKLSEDKWGFDQLIDGRQIDAQVRQEVRDLIEENIYDAIYENGSFNINFAPDETKSKAKP